LWQRDQAQQQADEGEQRGDGKVWEKAIVYGTVKGRRSRNEEEETSN
jgi:hypothetical protein